MVVAQPPPATVPSIPIDNHEERPRLEQRQPSSEQRSTKKIRTQQPTCCGVIEEATIAAREKREQRTKPQPWIALKLMVGITMGIIGYTGYAYLAHLCIPMIRRSEGAPAGRPTGIALVSVFSVLYLWMIWAYVVVILTPPGYAKDHVHKSERPLAPAALPLTFRDSFHSTALSHSHDPHTPYSDPEQQPESVHYQHSKHPSLATTSQSHSSSLKPIAYGVHPPQLAKLDRGLAGPSYEDLMKRDRGRESRDTNRDKERVVHLPPPAEGQDTQVGILDSIAHPNPHHQSQTSSTTVTHPPLVGDHPDQSDSSPSTFKLKKSKPTIAVSRPKALLKRDSTRRSEKEDDASRSKPKTSVKMVEKTQRELEKEAEKERYLEERNVHRRPPTTPLLDPAWRYCTSDGFVKPYRAHHCRICATCVLGYDHHCPWIGQCVGARNHKFFYNFCQATSVFTIYVFCTQLAYILKSNSSSTSFENFTAHSIVLLALAGLFFIFTFALLVSHTSLSFKSQTTVEAVHVQAMKDRERHTLARGFGWWEMRAKREREKKWDWEWGRVDYEGHLWWTGTRRRGWEQMMGKSVWGWFLPIGKSGSSGLDYTPNPRFDPDGRWRRRSEWPEELR